MERSKTENRSAYAQAMKRRDGAMRGMLGMGPAPDGDPVDERAARDRFHADLATMLPRLRIYAMSLTHDADRADDLVQQTVLNSLAGRRSFHPGTNFSGWLFRIERNEFISGLRRQRPTVKLDDTILGTLSHEPLQESGLVMREFKEAFRVLPGAQRKALLLTALDGRSHERIATQSGVSVGTVRSQVSRARATLRRLLGHDVDPSAPPLQH
jgi:RNA polymerase sigma-70 factor (ECF subfamily)